MQSTPNAMHVFGSFAVAVHVAAVIQALSSLTVSLKYAHY